MGELASRHYLWNALGSLVSSDIRWFFRNHGSIIIDKWMIRHSPSHSHCLSLRHSHCDTGKLTLSRSIHKKAFHIWLDVYKALNLPQVKQNDERFQLMKSDRKENSNLLWWDVKCFVNHNRNLICSSDKLKRCEWTIRGRNMQSRRWFIYCHKQQRCQKELLIKNSLRGLSTTSFFFELNSQKRNFRALDEP